MKRTSARSAIVLLALGLGASLASFATAQDAPQAPAQAPVLPPIKGSYELLPRTTKDGPKGNIQILEGDGQGAYLVIATEERPRTLKEAIVCFFRTIVKKPCPCHDTHWYGVGTLGGENGRVFKFTRQEGDPPESIGLVNKVDGAAIDALKDAKGDKVYICQFDPSFRTADVAIMQDGEPDKRAILTNKVELWDKIPGELIGLSGEKAQEFVKGKIEDRAQISKTFALGTFANLAVRVNENILDPGDLNDLQRTADLAKREAGAGLLPFWIRSTLEGGVKGGYSIPIPIATGAQATVGFAPGVNLHYASEDQFTLELPADAVADFKAAPWETVKRAAKLVVAAPARVIRLPITDKLGSGSDKMLALPMGSHRVVDGQASLGVSAGVSVGENLASLTPVKDVIDIGAQAGISVNWNVQGDFQAELYRGDPKGEFGAGDPKNTIVSLLWKQGSSSDLSGGPSAFIGVALKDNLLTDKVDGLPLTGLTKTVANAGANAVQGKAVAYIEKALKYARVEFSLTADWLKSHELSMELCFDLADPACRTAFEAAVLGDLTKVQALHAAQEGLPAEKRTLKRFIVVDTLTTELSGGHNIQLTVLDLKGSRDAKTVVVKAEGTDGTKVTTTNLDDKVDSSHKLLDKGVEQGFEAAATRRDFVKIDGSAGTGLTVPLTFHYADDHMSRDEMTKVLAAAQMALGADDPVLATARQKFDASTKDNFGHVDVRGTLTLDDAGIGQVLATDQNTFMSTYAGTLGYSWGASGPSDDAGSKERSAYDRATSIWKGIQEAQTATAAGNRDGRAKALRDFTVANGIDFHATMAVWEIAKQSPDGLKHAQVDIAVSGNGFAFSRTVGDFSAVPDPTIR